MKHIVYGILLIHLPLYIHAMEQPEQTIEQYKGKYYHQALITPEILPSFTEPPYALHMTARTWIQEHKELVNELLKFKQVSNRKELEEEHNRKLQLLKHYNLQNLSTYNYKFSPDKQIVFLIAGIWNSIRTRIPTVLNHDAYAKPLDQVKIYEASKPDVKIYQHVSAAAHYLLLKQWSEETKPQYIKLAPFYLIQRSLLLDPTDVHDQTYIGVQLFIPHLTEFRKLDEQRKKEWLTQLPHQTLVELKGAIKAGASWEIDHNICTDDNDPHVIWLVDFQQPNNSDGKFFYYQGKQGKELFEKHCLLGINLIANEVLKPYCPERLQEWLDIT